MAIDWALYAKAAAQFIGSEKTRKGVLAIIGIVLAVVIGIVLFFVLIVVILVSMFGQIDGYYYPIPDVTVSSGFGEREPIRVYVPGTGWTTTSGFHSGTDFVAPMGTMIYASAAGEVIAAHNTESGMLGLYITIEHEDGSLTKYCHCSELLVDVGDIVAGFQPIAKVGSTGASTGPHLHFELWVENGTFAIDEIGRAHV